MYEPADTIIMKLRVYRDLRKVFPELPEKPPWLIHSDVFVKSESVMFGMLRLYVVPDDHPLGVPPQDFEAIMFNWQMVIEESVSF